MQLEILIERLTYGSTLHSQIQKGVYLFSAKHIESQTLQFMAKALLMMRRRVQ